MCMYSKQQNQRGTSGTALSRITTRPWTSSHSPPYRYYHFVLTALLLLLLHDFMRDDVHLLPILRGVNALMPRSTTKSREARYFTQSCLIPPLEPLTAADNNNFTLHSDKINTGALPVVYTNDPKTVSQWLNQHVSSGTCTIGFDLESVPNAPWVKRTASFRGPAVIQVSTPTHALVVHLAKASGRPSRATAPLIESILRDENVVKAGCAIDQDLMELYSEWGGGLEARSRFDLGGIGGDKRAVTGLRTLCAGVLHLKLPKSKRLAMSDWSQLPLTDAQLCYCARDAWVGAAVAAELEALSPETFAPGCLARRLRMQRTLRDLTQRQANRKQAKQLLVAIQAPYSFARKKRVGGNSLPEWKKKIVDELKRVMRDNRYDGLEVYDALELGLEAMVNRTI